MSSKLLFPILSNDPPYITVIPFTSGFMSAIKFLAPFNASSLPIGSSLLYSNRAISCTSAGALFNPIADTNLSPLSFTADGLSMFCSSLSNLLFVSVIPSPCPIAFVIVCISIRFWLVLNAALNRAGFCNLSTLSTSACCFCSSVYRFTSLVAFSCVPKLVIAVFTSGESVR